MGFEDVRGKRASVVALALLVGCVEYEVNPKTGGTGDGPIIAVSPEVINFGALASGEEATEVVTVSNIGSATLNLLGVELEGAEEFTISADAMLEEVEPGDYTEFRVTYTSAGTAEEGLITVTSDDTSSTESYVTLTSGAVSTGEEDPDAPVAVCEASPSSVTSHSQTIDWLGEDSYDPNGGSITKYTWTLISQPSGSAVAMSSGSPTSPNRTDFEWDLAGEYVAQLVVENDAGVQSAPCETTATAAPSDDFWIEMYWEQANDDMDLHLLRPGGSMETSGDCYYLNCVGGMSLDWGTRGDDADNPSLDLDDIPGTGPENIRIESPESGEFTVVVNDYPGSVFSGDNDVTVSIYIGGELAWSGTKAIRGEDADVSFATVTFPDGEVTPE